jgi:misacylated tRNA(Ala) deacylase
MTLAPTQRLYLQDGGLLRTTATVLAVRADWVALDRSVVYPGGGGQPPDRGTLALDDGRVVDIVEASADAQDVIWHRFTGDVTPAAGAPVTLAVDAARRAALSRYHTVLHVLNTVALRSFDAWIAGCRIGAGYARFDSRRDRLSTAVVEALQAGVNAVLAGDHAVRSLSLPEDEFRGRPELLRTLDVRPPVVDGLVRVIEIEGFDAQACGGTHVAHAGEIGRLRIVRTENKGRDNKRLYVEIDAPLPAGMPA